MTSSPGAGSLLPGLVERWRLRREYLWIPHLSKRDLYARVLWGFVNRQP